MRSLAIRFGEHMKDWRNGKNKSAISWHMLNDHHITTPDNTVLKLEILDYSKDTVDNMLKEVFYINKLKPQLNRKHEYISHYHI